MEQHIILHNSLVGISGSFSVVYLSFSVVALSIIDLRYIIIHVIRCHLFSINIVHMIYCVYSSAMSVLSVAQIYISLVGIFTLLAMLTPSPLPPFPPLPPLSPPPPLQGLKGFSSIHVKVLSQSSTSLILFAHIPLPYIGSLIVINNFVNYILKSAKTKAIIC